MSEQENIKIVRQYFEHMNRRNNDANRSLLSDDARTEATGELKPLNKEQTLQYNQRYIDAFTDLHFDLKEIIAQGDQVAVYWIATGTFSAPLSLSNGGSLPATHRKSTDPGVNIVQVRNNQITHQTIIWDQVGFLMQVGLLTEQDMMAMTKR